jgi:hypothetical protein
MPPPFPSVRAIYEEMFNRTFLRSKSGEERWLRLTGGKSIAGRAVLRLCIARGREARKPGMEDRAAKFCETLGDNIFDTHVELEVDQDKPTVKPGFRFGRRAKPSPTAKITTPEERRLIDEYLAKNPNVRVPPSRPGED